jgi:signal transduction histidine kinase
MNTVTVATLKAFEALQNVPDEQLQWLIDNSENRIISAGELFTSPGQPMTGPHFIIDGHLQGYIIQNGSQREFWIAEPGEITGYLPFSRGTISKVYMKVLEDVQILSYPTDKIRAMIESQFELTQALVHLMSDRVRSFTTYQQQNEKMMALGKLSAGLAHELNNPASAIVRDSVSLIEHLKMQPEAFKKVIAIQMEAAQVDGVQQELFKILTVKDRPVLTLKEKSKREDEIADWFEEHGVEDNYDIAETFVDYSFDTNSLELFNKHIPDAFLGPVFSWISDLLVTERMVEDIQESARRIADLVSSVKTFTHMDRGMDKQFADIHVGIRNTITMLGYKLKKGNVTLVEDFDTTLPPVKAMIGELNQVWTNLIDNALDAMEPNSKGTLTIKTERDREFVQVCIMDDGPGIADDIISQIFDPFFTTKEMGKGTGMGLEVVQRIVKQHDGSIKAKSVPGRTEFLVCFPING